MVAIRPVSGMLVAKHSLPENSSSGASIAITSRMKSTSFDDKLLIDSRPIVSTSTV